MVASQEERLRIRVFLPENAMGLKDEHEGKESTIFQMGSEKSVKSLAKTYIKTFFDEDNKIPIEDLTLPVNNPPASVTPKCNG